VIYIALTRRDPVVALLAGAMIGMAQDSLTRGPIGLLGVVKTVVGYVTSYVSLYLDTESTARRLLTICFLYSLHVAFLYLVGAILQAQPIVWNSQDQLIAMLANALVGVLLFKALDRFRKPA